MFKCTVNYKDGNICNCTLKSTTDANTIKYTINENLDYSKISSVDFWFNDFEIKAGDEGYFVMPGGCENSKFKDSGLGYFKHHNDVTYISPDALMPNFGLKHKCGTFVAVVTGMPADSWHMVTIKDNKYTLGMRVVTKCRNPYEPLSMLQILLPEDATYNDMAKVYRNYLLSNGFTTIKQRLNSSLKYT
ncbi:MAG: hypothetical protein IKV86_01430, partial [Clostridia bacterium]|nr:hypothetical protein [Clostridia bacterium]